MKAKYLVRLLIVCIVSWYSWWALGELLTWTANQAALDRAHEAQKTVWTLQMRQYEIDHGQELQRLQRR